MGKYGRDLSLEAAYEAWSAEQHADAHRRWAQERLAEDPEADVSEEAYDDTLVTEAEARAEEAEWKRGCGAT